MRPLLALPDELPAWQHFISHAAGGAFLSTVGKLELSPTFCKCCRTSSLQGTMATLRMQLDGAAKQRDNLHRQLQQSAAPQNGLAAFSAQETARQLQALRQELAFKEQEVNKQAR